jgi:hypothetical protein
MRRITIRIGMIANSPHDHACSFRALDGAVPTRSCAIELKTTPTIPSGRKEKTVIVLRRKRRISQSW